MATNAEPRRREPTARCKRCNGPYYGPLVTLDGGEHTSYTKFQTEHANKYGQDKPCTADRRYASLDRIIDHAMQEMTLLEQQGMVTK